MFFFGGPSNILQASQVEHMHSHCRTQGALPQDNATPLGLCFVSPAITFFREQTDEWDSARRELHVLQVLL